MEEQNMNQNNMEENKASESTPEQPAAPEATATSDDVEKNKAMAIIGYIIPILFFIPLVTEAKNSPFAKFHANQQLNLLIAAVVVNVVGGIIPFIGWFLLLPIGSIIILVLAIMGLINAIGGKMKKLPIIGGFEIIK